MYPGILRPGVYSGLLHREAVSRRGVISPYNVCNPSTRTVCRESFICMALDINEDTSKTVLNVVNCGLDSVRWICFPAV